MTTFHRSASAAPPAGFPRPTPGMAAARVMIAKGVAGNDLISAEGYARAQRWLDEEQIVNYIKAGVPSINSTGGVSDIGADLWLALRPMSIIGRLLGVRPLPVRTSLLLQTTRFSAAWLAEGESIPMSKAAFSRGSMEYSRVASITVVSNELLHNASVDAARAITTDMLAAGAYQMDRALVDRTNDGSGNRPVSLTYGVTPITCASGAVAAIDAALKAAVQQLTAQGNNLRTCAWVMSEQLAVALSLLRGSGGALAYPDVGVLGGSLCGLPVLTSAAVDAEGVANGKILLLDGGEVSVAYGEPILMTSTSATIDMNAVPGEGELITPVSMFTAEATALLCSLRVTWKTRRQAAAIIQSVPF